MQAILHDEIGYRQGFSQPIALAEKTVVLQMCLGKCALYRRLLEKEILILRTLEKGP